jgi:hypothetical protein
MVRFMNVQNVRLVSCSTIYPKYGMSFLRSALTTLGICTITAIAPLSSAIAQTVADPDNTITPNNTIAQNNSNQDVRSLSGTGFLSTSGGQRLIQEGTSAAASQNYDLAVQKLQQARQLFNQLAGFHQQLAASFSGIDTRVADEQRQKAIEVAQLRDEATLQLAVVHRAQNKPELAVPLLIQIISSQNPTRELGQRAYQQLFELGFVQSQYPRAGGAAPAPAPAR